MKLINKKLAEIFLDYINQAPKLSDAVEKIAAYLVETRQTSQLRSILRTMENTQAAKTGLIEIKATSAFPLEPEIKQEIAKLFKARRAIFHETNDRNVLGGASFESLDKKIDLTLKHKLDQLRSS